MIHWVVGNRAQDEQGGISLIPISVPLGGFLMVSMFADVPSAPANVLAPTRLDTQGN